jgi:glyoxylase-like metal-dependent hydrolase (beta-lactamase superfamily II)
MYTKALFLLFICTIQVIAQPNDHPWFKTKKLNESVWYISDGDADNIYLIVGRDSAMLIDTGIGLANLRSYVRKITRLPLIVVNTHSHPDHTGGSYQFDKVYCHPADVDMINFFNSKEMRKRIAPTMGGIQLADSLKFPLKDSLFTLHLAPVADKRTFNLGDRLIEVVHVPGHTPGSICLLDHKDKYLYTGDNDNILVWLHPQDALPLDVYLTSLEKLSNRNKEFHTLMPGHGAPIDNKFIGEQIECVKTIIAGKCTGEPYDSFVGKGLVCSFQRAKVVYDPAKITSKK